MPTENAKSKSTAVAVAVVILASLVLLTVAVLFTFRPSRTVTRHKTGDVSYEVLNVDASTLESLSWEREGDSFTVRADDGGELYWVQDPEFPLNGDGVRALAENLKNLTADTVFTDVTDTTLASYGLSAPTLRVTVRDRAYGEHTLLVGKESNLEDAGYYVALSSDTATVYRVQTDLVSAFCVTPYDMMRVDTFPVLTAGTLTRITLTDGEDTLVFTKGDTADPLAAWSLRENGGEEHSVTATSMESLLAVLGTARFSEVASWKRSDLAIAGIREDKTLTVEYEISVQTSAGTYQKETHTVTLRFGDRDKDGYDRVVLADLDGTSGGNTVYLFDIGDADRDLGFWGIVDTVR